MLKNVSTERESFPFAIRLLATIRNIALVAVAICSKYFDDCMARWVIAFAAITVAATGLAHPGPVVVRVDPYQSHPPLLARDAPFNLREEVKRKIVQILREPRCAVE